MNAGQSFTFQLGFVLDFHLVGYNLSKMVLGLSSLHDGYAQPATYDKDDESLIFYFFY